MEKLYETSFNFLYHKLFDILSPSFLKMMVKSPHPPENIWDEIAESFSKTRGKPWKQCLEFIKKQSSPPVLLDLACGNGRHLQPASDHAVIAVGADKSRKLLEITRQRIVGKENIELIQLDAQALPLKDSSVDVILFVAALHNIKGRHNRIQVLSEIKRILQTNGMVLIIVWRRWQTKWRNFFLKEFFLTPWNFISGKEFGDIQIPWRADNMDISRFYHLYSTRDLKKEIRRAGLDIVMLEKIKIAAKKTPDNYLVIAKKQMSP